MKATNDKRRSGRAPYSDLGMMIAVSVFTILLVKCLLFDFTWVSIVWMMLSVAYFVLSCKYSSHSSIVRRSTTAFIVVSVLAIVAIFTFDQNARPKMHAFIGSLNDTIKDETEFVVKDKPVVMENVADSDSIRVDTLLTDIIESLGDDDEYIPENGVVEDNTVSSLPDSKETDM